MRFCGSGLARAALSPACSQASCVCLESSAGPPPRVSDWAGCWPQRTVTVTPLTPQGSQLRPGLVATARTQNEGTAPAMLVMFAHVPGQVADREGCSAKWAGDSGSFLPPSTAVHEGVTRERSAGQFHCHDRFSSDRSIREDFLVEATESNTHCNVRDASPETA